MLLNTVKGHCIVPWGSGGRQPVTGKSPVSSSHHDWDHNMMWGRKGNDSPIWGQHRSCLGEGRGWIFLVWGQRRSPIFLVYVVSWLMMNRLKVLPQKNNDTLGHDNMCVVPGPYRDVMWRINPDMRRWEPSTKFVWRTIWILLGMAAKKSLGMHACTWLSLSQKKRKLK